MLATHTMPLAAAVTIFLVVLRLYQAAVLSRKRMALKQLHGALPVQWSPSAASPLARLTTLVSQVKSMAKRRFLEQLEAQLFSGGRTTVKTLLLGRSVVVTVDPVVYKAVWGQRNLQWNIHGDRVRAFDTYTGSGLLSAQGDSWRISRSLSQACFSRVNLLSADSLEVHASSALSQIPGDGTVIDLPKLVNEYSRDTSLDFVFGESELLSGHSKSSDRLVLVDQLIQKSSRGTDVEAQLFNVVGAGQETTTATLANLWHYVSKNPNVWRSLQADIASLGGKRPTLNQVRRLDYLRAVVDETLRLRATSPLVERAATEDIIIPAGGGPDGLSPALIRKGDIVQASLYAMHRRRDLYGPDAQEFRPERWLEKDDNGVKRLRPTGAFAPFSFGPRNCLGQEAARSTISYLVVRLCQTFDRIESADDEPWTEHLSATVTNVHGAKVRLFAREKE
ncbi:hypothetical protein CDD80_6329 [Ophiocordyceps camponoti-rufipedis]|uniref:Cytochrome P450 n=1 Tax=Ophiocordyceps camponoti-rufipedis TaxID=2004952 RepID=A0A2C5YR31_9HYPO|nr:hypothetical protein CDD80_6329 [Ophiocordyceps camponoti-rufipedis]